MRAVLLTLVAVLAVAAGAAAKARPLGLQDDGGDGSPDLRAVSWVLDEATGELVLDAYFAPAPPVDVEVHWLWARGEPGQQQPAEWYLVFAANADSAFAGHGDQVRAADVNVTRDGAHVVARLARVDPVEGSCIFVAAEAGAGGSQGFTRADTVPDLDGDLSDGWPLEGGCPPQVEPDMDVQSRSKGSPGVSLVLLAAVVLVGAALRRR